MPDGAEDVMNNNRMRGELDSALAALKLFSTDEATRAAAIKQLQSDADETKLPLIEKAYAAEGNAQLKEQIGLVRAGALLSSADKAKRLEAAKLLRSSKQANTKTMLLARIKVEAEPDVKSVLQLSLREVEAALAWGDDSVLQFGGGTLGHPWGNAAGATANRVALEACVRARNEGREVEREARAILTEAAADSPALAIAMETWKEIKFDYDVVDKLAAE